MHRYMLCHVNFANPPILIYVMKGSRFSQFLNILQSGVLLVCFYVSTSLHASEPEYDHRALSGLAQSYGFVFGQAKSLELIEAQFPSLANSVMLARTRFEAAFPTIREELEIHIRGILGKTGFERFRDKAFNKISEELNAQALSYDLALQFISKVNDRAAGEIESPFREYLLSVRFRSQPADEYLKGFQQRFNSTGHLKSQGIDLTLRVPLSWKALEGERPHIVHKWVNKVGTGSVSILLDIRDADGFMPSKKDIKDTLASGEIANYIPSSASFIDSGAMTLEAQNGLWYEMSQRMNRLDADIYLHASMYQFYFREKQIGVMCTAAGMQEDMSNIIEIYRSNHPVCLQVVNSIVLDQIY